MTVKSTEKEINSDFYQEDSLYYFQRGGYTYNLGYREMPLTQCTITFGQKGDYSADDIQIVCLPMPEPALSDGELTGIVDIVDPNFGNAWTNIPLALFEEAGISYGDMLHLRVRHGDELVLECDLPFCRTFGEVGRGELLAYTNELMNVSFTMNQASVVERFGIGFGGDWYVSFERAGA